MTKEKKVLAIIAAIIIALTVVVFARSAGAATGKTRFSDTSPWFGGDQVASTTARCTSGFQAFDHSGKHYTFTASHCGSSTDWQVGTTKLGVTTVYNNALDVQLIREKVMANNTANIFTSSDSTARTVYNWETTAQDRPGLSECFSGSTSQQEICGTVDKVGQSWNSVKGSTAAQAVYVRCPLSYVDCTVKGDEGAPAYAIIKSGSNAGQVEATGIMVGSQPVADDSGFHVDWVFIPIRLIMAWIHSANPTFNLDCSLCS